MTTRRLLATLATLAALAVAPAARAAPAATTTPAPGSCGALPRGLALVVAGGGAWVTADGATETLTVAPPAGPPSLAARGADGTVWTQVPAAEPREPGDAAVYRVPPGGDAQLSTDGPARISSVGSLGGRVAAVIVDEGAEQEVEDFTGMVLVEFADGEQVEVHESSGPEFGIGSATLGADRIVETAYVDLTEAIDFSDAAGNRLTDWPSPTADADYNAPPLYLWAIAAATGGEPVLSWVEGPDWDIETEALTGGWSLVVAAAPTGAERQRIDLGEQPSTLVHADFDGRFWVGTFGEVVDPGGAPTIEPGRVVVVDTAAAAPAPADAGCATGTIATIDRLGGGPPPAARCTYVEADDAYPLRRCDKGAAVAAVQEQINRRGQSIEVDGYFGPDTERAVRAFQQAAGLEVDGLVGPLTWAALYTGDPAGADADGNGSIEPWEVTAEASGVSRRPTG